MPLILDYFRDRRRAARFYRDLESSWRDRPAFDFEAVDSLRILPLMDQHAERSDLETEPGVSYLVQAGDKTLLFDLGLNEREEDTPPLVRNMERLGVDPASIDLVVVSHPHSDHLGGMRNKKTRRAVVRENNDPLAGKPVYATVLLTVTGGASRVVEGPARLAAGIATTGPLAASLITGYVLEQSLVVNIAGTGLVLIVGCGHPGLERIVESTERIFQRPIYGIVGGLHYPITQDRRAKGWFKPQKVHGNPNPPWRPLTRDTVRRAIAYLQEKNMRLVSLSPHDSCDWAIDAFRAAFGPAYVPLQVGKEIVVQCHGRTGSQRL